MFCQTNWMTFKVFQKAQKWQVENAVSHRQGGFLSDICEQNKTNKKALTYNLLKNKIDKHYFKFVLVKP